MKILLTGASGFVGSHALRHLLVNTDHEIVAPVSYRHRGTPDRIASALGLHCQVHTECKGDPSWMKRVRIIHTDLRSEFTATTLHQIGDIDQIWNIASESHVDRSLAEPVDFIRSNVDIALAMGENCRQLQPDLFLQMSTDEVYGPADAEYSHKEWDAIKPSNPYSASKAAQEAILYSYWRAYGIPLVITNTMNIVGETQDAEKFVPMILRKIQSGGKMSIHSDLSDPENPVVGGRCWLHARNLADAWLWLSEDAKCFNTRYNKHLKEPHRFHIVGDEMSNLELALAVTKASGGILNYELEDFHASRPGHDLRYSLDGTKIAGLGWKAPVEIGQSIETLVRWTLDHPEWLA